MFLDILYRMRLSSFSFNRSLGSVVLVMRLEEVRLGWIERKGHNTRPIIYWEAVALHHIYTARTSACLYMEKVIIHVET